MTIKERRLDVNGEPTVLSFEQNQAILQLYRYGFPVAEVAEFFGLSTTAVYYKYRKFKKAKVTQDKKPSIEATLIKEGYEIWRS